MLYDFHTHTLLSDGVLSPLELARRASLLGCRVIAFTDHAGIGYVTRLVSEIAADCAVIQAHWGITAIAGVELTHAPARAIPELARQAKEAGAKLVVVHGETITEPVEKGTNWAALQSPHVDILAHPGLLTLEEAQLAAEHHIFLEISSRKGHCLTNGHVVKMARLAGAKLLLNSDAHDESDLLSPELALSIARGAGLEENEFDDVLQTNPRALLNKLQL